MRVLALLPAAALALAACAGDECDGSCADAFVVSLAGIEVRSGTYVVTAIADGEPVRCEVTLPDREPRVPTTCTNPAATLTLGPAQTLGQLVIAGQPRQVQVIVTLDGAEVTSGVFAPVYQDVRMGPGCPVACRQASAALRTPGILP